MTVRLASVLALAVALVVPAHAGAQSLRVADDYIADMHVSMAAEKWSGARRAADGQTLGPDGQVKPADYLPHVTPADFARQSALDKELLALVDDPRVEHSARQVDAAVLRTLLNDELVGAAYREWEMPLSSDSNFWTYLDEAAPLDSEADYRAYLARMADLPRYFGENIANMRAGMARGFTVPKVTLAGRDASIAAFVTEDPAASPFYAAFAAMPDIIAPAAADALRAQARAVIAAKVTPAYARLLDFFRDEYLPAARTSIADEALPDGPAYYAAQIRRYTTLDMGAEEIHALGLARVAAISAQMDAIRQEVGFAGTLPEFIAALRSDPRFTASSPDALVALARDVAARSEAALPRFFGALPARKVEVRAVAPALAPFYTAGRGGLDYCQINTHDLPSRPVYNIPALTLHECTPGHSFQLALAAERPAVPDFRREVYFSGYGEGWGLYVEALGNEMGIYRDPYERFGQLTYAMWRAARLVIDTGVHHYGWSREQAVAYLADHTALSRHEVETEVDRYISWPGQALAYQLGADTIVRLRKEAEANLGAKFDIRKFHDVVLATGSVPLPVLEDRIAAFIADGGQGLPGVTYP